MQDLDCAQETITSLTRNSEHQSGELKAEIGTLKDMLTDRQSELRAKTQEFTASLSSLEASHAQTTRELERNLSAKTDEVETTNREAGQLREDVASLRRQLEILHSDRENLQAELTQARRPSEAHAEELIHLRRNIELLQKVNEECAHRASSTLSRYEKGDLVRGQQNFAAAPVEC